MIPSHLALTYTHKLLCYLANPQIHQLAIEGGAADAQAAGHFRHAAAIMADGKTDHVGLDGVQRAQVAVGGVEHDAGALVLGHARHGGHGAKALDQGPGPTGSMARSLRSLAGGTVT